MSRSMDSGSDNINVFFLLEAKRRLNFSKKKWIGSQHRFGIHDVAEHGEPPGMDDEAHAVGPGARLAELEDPRRQLGGVMVLEPLVPADLGVLRDPVHRSSFQQTISEPNP